MDLATLMQTRRSIRAYEDRPVPEAVMEKILEAGLWAPSGKNMQNWRFFVLTGQRVKDYLALSQKTWEASRPVLEKRLKPSLLAFTERFFYTLGNAPVLVFVYHQPHPDENNQTGLGSVYMAVQNILLAAHAEGLGACPLGSPLEVKDAVDRFLGVSQTDLQLVCGITLGYPAHQPPAAPRQREGRIIWLD
ncbi:MAG: nitroreductase family protein [Candidatus Melainabacteria bacterium]